MNKDEARLAVMGAISMALKDPTLQQGFEIICKENATLEKENAELKEQHEVSARNMSSFIESLSKSENEAKKQLTKAKEIIKELLSSCFGYNSKTVNYEIKAEAEQFLKDCKVEK
jgi:uncharacterized protein (UPF0335 family)